MTEDDSSKITPDLETVPLLESHKAKLERRLADLDENSEAGNPWEEVRARLAGDLAKHTSTPKGR
jgi:putative addiction module component (TIGR02574 family)